MLDTRATMSLRHPHRDAQQAHDPPRTPCVSLRWACVYSHPEAERWAQATLVRRGYPTFLPLITISRRDRVLRSLRHSVEVPAFPRYVFVRHEPGAPTHPIAFGDGIAGLVKMGTDVAYASDAIIAAIRTAIAEANCTRQPEHSWAPGDPVRLTIGALAGHPAVVLSVRRVSARVAVLALGALREAVVPIAALSPRT